MAQEEGHSPGGRGALIVVEGLDRAGKSTQCLRLVENLKEGGFPAELMRFPDRTTAIGQNLHAYLTRTDAGTPLPLAAAHLLFAANRWEAAAALQHTLAAGTSVIVDRYAYSGAVYTAARAALSAAAADRHMDLDWTWAPEVGLPAPDLLIFLDVEELVAQHRGGFGAERYETTDMQRAVRRTFDRLLARLEPQPTARIARVDANHDMETIVAAIWAATADVRRRLGEGSLPPLHKLQPLPPDAAARTD